MLLFNVVLYFSETGVSSMYDIKLNKAFLNLGSWILNLFGRCHQFESSRRLLHRAPPAWQRVPAPTITHSRFYNRPINSFRFDRKDSGKFYKCNRRTEALKCRRGSGVQQVRVVVRGPSYAIITTRTNTLPQTHTTDGYLVALHPLLPLPNNRAARRTLPIQTHAASRDPTRPPSPS